MLVVGVILGTIISLFLLTVLFGAPYVPSHRRDIARAFDELVVLTDKDLVVDIGSGDGVVCREVSRRGARAVGFEINPVLVTVARWLSHGDTRVQYKLVDIWRTEVPEETTVIYVFGTGRDVKRLKAWSRQQATRLGRPLRIVSYAFEIPGWQPVSQTKTHLLYIAEPLQEAQA